MLTAILAITTLAALCGLLLGAAVSRWRVQGDPLADQVDALLPQTQCGQCGYAGCRPYAQALAAGEAAINQCVPGGEVVVLALAQLLGREPVAPAQPRGPAGVAVIDAQECIGCTLCLKACPVDAIIGAPKQLHGIIARDCTGCGLCLAPCPVACIRLVPVGSAIERWRWPDPADRRAA